MSALKTKQRPKANGVDDHEEYYLDVHDYTKNKTDRDEVGELYCGWYWQLMKQGPPSNSQPVPASPLMGPYRDRQEAQEIGLQQYEEYAY